MTGGDPRRAMSCASIEQLAAGDVAEAHVGECLVCRRGLDEQRAVRAQLAAMTPPGLSTDRRRALSAEVMAAEIPTRSPAWRYAAVAIVAAAIVLVVRGASTGDAPLAAKVQDHAPLAHAAPNNVDRGPPAPIAEARGCARTPAGDPANATCAPAGRHAPAIEASTPAGSLDGAVDNQATDPPRAPRAKPRADSSRAVFGESQSSEGHEITRDELYSTNPSLLAFRQGWEALRANRYDDAIAAFDRATDPVVAEDAAFWAAVAAERANRADEARRRFGDFASRFPDSPRIQRVRDSLR